MIFSQALYENTFYLFFPLKQEKYLSTSADMIRKDYPELLSIMNKAITSVSREEHDAIIQKWFSVRVEHQPNWDEIRYIVESSPGKGSVFRVELDLLSVGSAENISQPENFSAVISSADSSGIRSIRG